MTAHPLIRIILSVDPDDDDDDSYVMSADLSYGAPVDDIRAADVMRALHGMIHGGLAVDLARAWGEPDLEIPRLPEDACPDERKAFAAAALQAVGEVLQEAGVLPGNARVVGLVQAGTVSDN